MEFPLEDERERADTGQSLPCEEEKQLVLHVDRMLSLKRGRSDETCGSNELVLLEFPDSVKKARVSPGVSNAEGECSDMDHDGLQGWQGRDRMEGRLVLDRMTGDEDDVHMTEEAGLTMPPTSS